MAIFDFLLELTVVLTGIWGVYKGVKDWRNYVGRHRPFPYQPAENVERWRWSESPSTLALARADADEHSRLQLPDVRSTVNVIGSIIGCVLVLGALAILVNVFVLSPPHNRVYGPIFVCTCMIIGGRFMLDLDARLVAIDLQRDCAVFVVRYGVFLLRRIEIDRESVKSFSGEVQSAYSMAEEQREPNFYVLVKRRFSNKRFITLCNPSQGSWLIGGLEYWKKG